MNQFKETLFLNSVQKFCKSVGSVNREKGAKMVIAYAIRENQFEQDEVFTYLKKQLKVVAPESIQMMKSIPEWYLKSTAHHLGMTPKMVAIESTIDALGWIRLVNHLASIEVKEETTTQPEEQKQTLRTDKKIQTPVQIEVEEHKPGRGRKKRPVVQLTPEGIVLKVWESAGDAALQLGKGSLRCSINKCCNGDPKYPSVGGFRWKYKENSIANAA